MLKFLDGFDHYATADVTKKWTAISGSSVTIGAVGRRLSGQLRLGSSSYITKTLPASAGWVIGFAFRAASLPAGAMSIISLLDNGTIQCSLRLNPDGTLSATGGGSSTVVLSANAYYYIEWKVTIADSVPEGTCKVRVNGADVITIPAGQSVKATANAHANQIRLGNATTSPDIDFDDLYVCDKTGTTNNDFLGDCRVDTQFPNADGAVTNFATSSGATHYTLVDEVTPNTTDYVDSANVGDRDLYEFTNLTSLGTSTVYGVQVSTAVQKDDAGSRSIAVTARSNGTNVDGATQALSTSQLFHSSIFETDSAAVAWTQTSVDAAQFGIKVVA